MYFDKNASCLEDSKKKIVEIKVFIINGNNRILL